MHLTRRYFLMSTGAVALYLGVAPMSLLAGEARLVKPVTRRRTLVVIFLRGGVDGLNLVVPFGDPEYFKLRPTLALQAPTAQADAASRAIDLDGFFGLHPRLNRLLPHFQSGLAAAAHAVGYDKNTRSHFEEQDTWETGIAGNTIASDGWLNRHLATSEGHGPVRAVSIGDNLPRILHGTSAAFAVRGLEDLTLPQGRTGADQTAAALEQAYCSPPSEERSRRRRQGAAMDLLNQSAGVTLDGVRQLRALAASKYEPAAPYPRSGLANRLMQVARLIKADVGLEVAEVSLGGWDTHNNQGTGSAGSFANLAGELGDALAAFSADLGDRMDEVVVVSLSDFGRTAAENGTQGTDHGWGNAMLLMGGPVQRAARARATAKATDGGRPTDKVAGRWPGLAPEQLNQRRDLKHTTDFRDVIGELVSVHLGNPNLQRVLPSHQFKPVGLVV
jgi:uncharacterized protein (DUF1501 family)